MDLHREIWRVDQECRSREWSESEGRHVEFHDGYAAPREDTNG